MFSLRPSSINFLSESISRPKHANHELSVITLSLFYQILVSPNHCTFTDMHFIGFVESSACVRKIVENGADISKLQG